MTELEEKNIKTQLQLLTEINEANKSIIYCIRAEASIVLDSLKNKVSVNETIESNDKSTVVLNLDDFNIIVKYITNLAPKFDSPNAFGKINSDRVAKYLNEIELKSNILKMLS